MKQEILSKEVVKITCEHLRVRTKDYQKYLYCKIIKERISRQVCQRCEYKTYKKQHKIKNKSNKLAKIERKRFSILQEDDGQCFVCGKYFKKLDPHEAFGGCNRLKSIEYGLVYYICRLCHDKADVDKELRQALHDYARNRFIEEHSEEEFLKEFKNNYIRRN